MRVPVIAGNWKMYKTAREASVFVYAFLPWFRTSGVEIVLAPPFPSIATVADLVRGAASPFRRTSTSRTRAPTRGRSPRGW